MIVKFLVYSLILLLLAVSAYADDAIFDGQQWVNRVLVITGSKNAPEYIEQVQVLSSGVAQDGLEQRRVVVIYFKDGVLQKIPNLSPFEFEFRRYDKAAQQRYLQNRLGVNDDVFGVALVGLDGERKHVWDDVVDPAVLFEFIDAMPMRKRELQGK